MERDGYMERQELEKWRSYRTGSLDGYHSIKRDARGYPLFVKASQLSKSQFRDADVEGNGVTFAPEDESGEQLKDIFSASRRPRPESTFDKVAVSLPIVDDPNRGKAVASFYSSLPRETSTNSVLPYNPPRTTTHSQKLNHGSASTKRPSTTDWFIRKAITKLRDEEAKDKELKPTSTIRLGDGAASMCSVCLASLPNPLTRTHWESHRFSIAHQLAADGPAEFESSQLISAKRKIDEIKEQDQGGKVILKSSNVGYRSLERMGWRKGMGLGREEWEYGPRRERLEAKNERNKVIVISDSEEEEEDDRDMEIGSEQWLANIRRGQARLEASRPKVSSLIDVEEQEEIMSHQRPLLEPISVQFRPDRRGIGKSLPRSSRIVDDRKSKQGEQSIKVEDKRLIKSQRSAIERQEKEEWKQLRSSLD